MLDLMLRAVLIGIGATALLDLWAQLLRRGFGLPAPNWAMTGRWFGHLARGRARHESIAASEAVANELAIGWIAHYLVGILFALALLAIWGPGWAARPTLAPALIVGWVTVGCGWFILQPGMGAGVASSKRPDANRVRALNIAGHTIFGLGLYASALLIQ